MLYLVTGGSGSGKSAFAENFVTKLHHDRSDSNLYYIATMHSYDEESDNRIKRHRDMREGKDFVTIEKELLLGKKCFPVDRKGIYLLEDLSNLLANEMYIGYHKECFVENEGDGMPEGPMQGTEEILHQLFAISKDCDNLIIVSNEIFSDGTQYDKDTLCFMKQLGYMNCQLAGRADGVVEVVCGIPIWRKGKEQC